MIKRGYRFWDVKRNCYAPDDDFWITYKGEWATHLCSKYADYKGDDIIPEQSTGLRDKNKNDIYENDILKVGYTIKNDLGDIEWDEDTVHKVKWYGYDGYPAFDLVDSDCDMNGLAYIFQSGEQECEVIGNIHESPELLKGAN